MYVFNGQFTQVQDILISSFARIRVARKLYREGGLIKDGKIPMQEFDSQEGRGLIVGIQYM